MKSKFSRGLVAVATSVAVATAGVGVAPVASAQSADTASSGVAGTATYAVTSLVSLAIAVAFWGTVYNTLINHGTIRGTMIPQLPAL